MDAAAVEQVTRQSGSLTPRLCSATPFGVENGAVPKCTLLWAGLPTRLAARCAALYFATFDAGGGAMADRDGDDAAIGAFFRNFFSGMS